MIRSFNALESFENIRNNSRNAFNSNVDLSKLKAFSDDSSFVSYKMIAFFQKVANSKVEAENTN